MLRRDDRIRESRHAVGVGDGDIQRGGGSHALRFITGYRMRNFCIAVDIIGVYRGGDSNRLRCVPVAACAAGECELGGT